MEYKREDGVGDEGLSVDLDHEGKPESLDEAVKLMRERLARQIDEPTQGVWRPVGFVKITDDEKNRATIEDARKYAEQDKARNRVIAQIEFTEPMYRVVGFVPIEEGT